MPERPGAIAELRARQRKRAAETWNRLSRELDETEELITELRARCEAHGGG
jgi:hypothetical protein